MKAALCLPETLETAKQEITKVLKKPCVHIPTEMKEKAEPYHGRKPKKDIQHKEPPLRSRESGSFIFWFDSALSMFELPPDSDSGLFGQIIKRRTNIKQNTNGPAQNDKSGNRSIHNNGENIIKISTKGLSQTHNTIIIFHPEHS